MTQNSACLVMQIPDSYLVYFHMWRRGLNLIWQYLISCTPCTQHIVPSLFSGFQLRTCFLVNSSVLNPDIKINPNPRENTHVLACLHEHEDDRLSPLVFLPENRPNLVSAAAIRRRWSRRFRQLLLLFFWRCRPPVCLLLLHIFCLTVWSYWWPFCFPHR